MRCDDVFEILTAGPFPSGASTDEAVEIHLRSCHECRRFALALQPLAEAAESAGLPLYKGNQVGAGAQGPSSLEQSVRELVLRETPRRAQDVAPVRSARRGGWRTLAGFCAAACLLGAAAAWGGPLLTGGFSAGSASSEAQATLQPVNAAVNGLCHSEFAAHVQPSGDAPTTKNGASDACCLECHGGNQRFRSPRSETIGLVVMSCQKCHQAKPDWVRL